jgi:hypothetical protein
MSSCGKRWWDEDVEGFRLELTAFKPIACGSDGVLDSTGMSVSEFLARKRRMVAGIQKVIVPHILDVPSSELSTILACPGMLGMGSGTQKGAQS